MGYDVFAQLQRDAPEIDWTPVGGGEPDHEYALFSRSGFASSLEEARDERDDLRLYTVQDVIDAISK